MSSRQCHIFNADARHIPLADGCVHCVATSPPYWGLRKYEGVNPVEWPEVEYRPMPGLPPVRVPAESSCLGLERTPEAFIAHLVLIFREVRRVLREDGTCWVNMGDSYSNNTKWGGSSGGKNYTSALGGCQNQRVRKGKDCDPKRGVAAAGQPMHLATGLKPKDLCGMPWRLAFALQADGWFLRMDAIWAKPNPMPESVTDRPTKAHEYVFILAKSERYFFDAEAVKEPCASGASDIRKMIEKRQRIDAKHFHVDGGVLAAANYRTNIGNKRAVGDPSGRNLRSVWTITSKGFPGAHFATFPPRLPQIAVAAGTSARGCCPTCGAQWKRVVEKVRGTDGRDDVGIRHGDGYAVSRMDHRGKCPSGLIVNSVTTHWLPTCKCPAHDPVPCRVLDPFGGTATTAIEAARMGRTGIALEPSPVYVKLAQQRAADELSRTMAQPKRPRIQKHQTLFGLMEVA